jgi:hypothetical protein
LVIGSATFIYLWKPAQSIFRGESGTGQPNPSEIDEAGDHGQRDATAQGVTDCFPAPIFISWMTDFGDS